MIEQIDKKLAALQSETQGLVRQRSAFEQQIKHIDVRLTQIVGAITELTSMRKEIIGGEDVSKTSNTSESKVSRGTGEVEPKQDPSEDSLQAEGGSKKDPGGV